MANKQGAPSAPAPRYERGIFPKEQGLSLPSKIIEAGIEAVNPYPMNLETGQRELTVPGVFEAIAAGGKGVASFLKDPVGTYEKVAPALEQMGERMVGSTTLRPGQMQFVDGQMRPVTSEEVIQERIDSGMDPSVALTGAAPIAARTARMGVAGLMAQPGELPIFIPSHRNPEMHKKAQEMSIDGATPDEVFNETGVFVGRDNVLRYEIDDSKAKFVGDVTFNHLGGLTFSDIGYGKNKKLGDVLEHEELFARYPEARDIPISDIPMAGYFSGLQGSFTKGNPLSEEVFEQSDRMTLRGIPDAKKQGEMGPGDLDKAIEEAEKTLLHELQHYVQYYSDMHIGGSKVNFLPDDFTDVRKRANANVKDYEDALKEKGLDDYWRASMLPTMLDNIADFELRKQAGEIDPEIHRFSIADYERDMDFVERTKDILGENMFNDFVNSMNAKDILSAVDADAYQYYKRLGGEVEARMVEARKDMTAAERREAGIPDLESFLKEEQEVYGETMRSVRPSIKDEVIDSPEQMTIGFKEKYIDSIGDRVNEAKKLLNYDASSDTGDVATFRAGGIVGARPSVRGNSGIVDVIRKYRREGLMD